MTSATTSVTPMRTPEQIAELQQLAARIASGPQLHHSPRLRDFFDYVLDCALRDAPEEATEQQIGVHVFHRHPGYNSGDDSIVRSQARLLRAKLNAYFAAEGRAEPIVIEIPKGQYLPVFRPATPGVAPPDLAASDSDSQGLGSPTTESTFPSVLPDLHATSGVSAYAVPAHGPSLDAVRPHPVRLTWPLAIAAVLFGILLAAFGGYSLRGLLDHPPSPVLNIFWHPFYGSDESLVIFSNPAFIGKPETGLKLLPSLVFDPNDPDAYASLDETYTGTGEAAAIHTLTQLFAAHSSTFILKRSRLVTWDEARSRSLIFVGAPSQNMTLNDLPALTQFHIALTPDGHGYVVNLHPRPGEPASYPPLSLTQDTAIVALLPGFQPDTRIAIFSGLSTLGTEEAVDYFSKPESLSNLLQQLNAQPGLPPKPFEAVLQVRINKGVSVGATLLTVHPR